MSLQPGTAVAVTGASGFVGREVIAALRARGARPIALGRNAARPFPDDVETRVFDPSGDPNPQAFAGTDAVIHLAGESVSGRWTPEKKRRIADSRIAGTQALAASLRELQRRPAVLVCASAVGYYGDRGDEPLTESAAPGSDFLAGVCVAWEAAAAQCETFGIRTVQMRSGVALGRDGGALAQMKRPFEFFAGGPLGTGRQFVPWIDVRDLASLYCFAIERETLRGAVNAVAPESATNARVAHALGAALRRPSFLPAPAIALRLALGEFAQTVLGGQRAVPKAALDAGFTWAHPRLEADLVDLLG
ncbi:MAG TPA: TIGR01777 family oxidoreductase [Candidatus Cybelea sp.]